MRLIKGDCLEKMAEIEDGSVDMVLCDLPYGTTACKWDSVIPFEPLWAHYRRVCKKNAAIVLTANQPFTSTLVTSNIRNFKHSWIWDKVRPSGFQVAKHRPMSRHEDVLIFCFGSLNYYRQMEKRSKPIKGRVCSSSESSPLKYSDGKIRTYEDKNPQTIIQFCKGSDGKYVHPTQKPVALMEYLIRTYTNEGETILDNTMGSGTTGVACVNTKRKFIGIERDENYFKIAEERIKDAMNNMRLDNSLGI